MDEFIAEGDQVFHCAAMVSFDPEKKEEMMHLNEEGTANVVNICLDKKIDKLVYLSSVAAIGRKGNEEEITEENDWENSEHNSNYAKSKYAAEMQVWRGIAEGLNAVIVNPSIVLGEGDWEKGSCALFKTVYNEFPFYTNGITGFVDVKDVVKIMMMLMESDVSEERFILSENNYAYKTIFEKMALVMQKKPPTKEAKKWMIALVWRYYKLKSFFTGKPQTITKETALSAQSISNYSTKKLKTFFPDVEFTEMDKSIERIGKYYLEKK